jgi:hypothetical protein
MPGPDRKPGFQMGVSRRGLPCVLGFVAVTDDGKGTARLIYMAEVVTTATYAPKFDLAKLDATNSKDKHKITFDLYAD